MTRPTVEVESELEGPIDPLLDDYFERHLGFTGTEVEELAIARTKLEELRARPEVIRARSTKSVEEVSAAISGETSIHVASPTARLGWLSKALEELGLDVGYLSPARNLAARAADMNRRVVQQQRAAGKDRGEAVRRLVTDPTASFDEVAAVIAATAPWLDALPGQRSPAAQLAYDAGRMIEHQIDGQIAACGEKIFTLLQRKAREVVAEVAGLPPLPKSVWVSAAPHEDLGRIREHRATWGVLAAANLDFESVYRIAEQIRDGIGAGPDSLAEGAPRWALTFRNWKPLLNDLEFNSLKRPLRLPYAISHKYEPGLWRPQDVKVEAADQTFLAKLRNLGEAVMGGSAPAA